MVILPMHHIEVGAEWPQHCKSERMVEGLHPHVTEYFVGKGKQLQPTS